MMGIAPFIIKGGLRMSTQGQGDGGVYFSTLGPSSYELGSEKYEENIIIDCFGKERLEEYRGKHKLDLMFVYGVNPRIVEQAPGGRANAKMVSKSMFECFAQPTDDGNFFLRPDMIKAAILLDGTSGLPGGRDEALEGLEREKENDGAVQHTLRLSEEAMRDNSASNFDERRRLAPDGSVPIPPPSPPPSPTAPRLASSSASSSVSSTPPSIILPSRPRPPVVSPLTLSSAAGAGAGAGAGAATAPPPPEPTASGARRGLGHYRDEIKKDDSDDDDDEDNLGEADAQRQRLMGRLQSRSPQPSPTASVSEQTAADTTLGSVNVAVGEHTWRLSPWSSLPPKPPLPPLIQPTPPPPSEQPPVKKFEEVHHLVKSQSALAEERKSGLATFLSQDSKLKKYIAPLTEYGIESVDDLADEDIIDDDALKSEIGMKAKDVKILRQKLSGRVASGSSAVPSRGVQPSRGFARRFSRSSSSRSNVGAADDSEAPMRSLDMDVAVESVVASPTASSHEEERASLAEFLLQDLRLGKYLDVLTEYGIGSLDDLVNEDLIDDGSLRDEIGMAAWDIQYLRALRKELVHKRA